MNLNRKEIEDFRLSIARLCRLPAIDIRILQNGKFIISDLDQSTANRIIYLLKQQAYIDTVNIIKNHNVKSSDLWKMAAYPNKDFTRYSIEGLLKETLQEEYGYGYSRYELIDALKKLGYKYKWDKYSDAQLYYMLNWAENKKVKIEKENQEAAEETAKLYSNQKKNKKLDWYTQYKGYDIYIDDKLNAFSIEGINQLFNSDQEAIEYIDNMIDDEIIDESRKKKKKDWYNMPTANCVKRTQSAIMSTAGTDLNINIMNHNLSNNLNNSGEATGNASSDTSSSVE